MDTRRMVGGCRVMMALVAAIGTIVPGSRPGDGDRRRW